MSSPWEPGMEDVISSSEVATDNHVGFLVFCNPLQRVLRDPKLVSISMSTFGGSRLMSWLSLGFMFQLSLGFIVVNIVVI